MKNTIAVAALAALALTACDQPLEPRVSELGTKLHLTNAAYTSTTGDAIAYTRCDLEYVTESETRFVCDLVVQAADGSEKVILREGEDIPVQQIAHSWSPDGTKIAVDGQGFSVVTLADGSVTGPADISVQFPDWSPDGGQIAFLSDRDGPLDVYVMNAADFSNVTRLATGVGVNGTPTWSPDGARLVFGCEVETGNRDLCAINADGSGFARLTSGASADLNPDFSPDGAQVAFVSGGEEGYALHLLNVADGTVARTYAGVDESSRPQWSPDGRRIAYSWCCSGGVDPADRAYYHGDYTTVVNLNGSGGGDIVWIGSNPVWRPTLPINPDTPPAARFSFSCLDLTCSFDGSASTDDWHISRYDWTYGDNASGESGWSSSTFTYAAAGSYQVTLTVHDVFGQASSTTQTVTVGEPPDLPPTASFTSNCAGLTCSFDSGASSDDKGIASRSWTFGDATSAGDITAPSHIYGAGGTYSVTLTVTDTKGQTNSITQNVTAVDQPPIARFTYACGSASRGQTSCTFDGRSSSDDAGIVSYSWKLGDKGTATGAVVTTSFKFRSTQVITLTVKDAANQASSTTQTITLK